MSRPLTKLRGRDAQVGSVDARRETDAPTYNQRQIPMRYSKAVAVLLFVTSLSNVMRCDARTSEQETVVQASAVLQQIMAVPASGIPRALLAKAQAVAIVPDVKSGAFVLGIRKGRGVIVARDDQGAWTAPQFINLTGGSLGWQAGIQSTDVILVFRSRESLARLMSGKLTIGADASVAAGPVGRQAAAATDLSLKSEIYSYSRSRGAFLGVSIEGSMIAPDPQADARFYQTAAGQPGGMPPSAMQLVSLISQYAGGGAVAAAPIPTGAPFAAAAPMAAAIPATVPPQFPMAAPNLQRQLAEAWPGLAAITDPAWQQYLSPTISDENPDSVKAVLQRYETVAASPQYAALVERPQFQHVLALLRQLEAQQQAAARGQLQLPPPPIGFGR
ncbi:MAG: lipid-binding SYLF domain-containing protein [Planctomycetota bacterium]